MASRLYYAAKAFLEYYEKTCPRTLGKEYWELRAAINKIKGSRYTPKQPAMYTAERRLQSNKTLHTRIQLCIALLSTWNVEYDVNKKYSLICDCKNQKTGQVINVLISRKHDCSIKVIVFKFASGKNAGSGLTAGEVITLTKEIRKSCLLKCS
jgi:hypothetical protein